MHTAYISLIFLQAKMKGRGELIIPLTEIVNGKEVVLTVRRPLKTGEEINI